MIVAIVLLSAAVVFLLLYIIGLRHSLNSLSVQIRELLHEDTNLLVRNKSGLKILNPLINSINDGVAGLRQRVIRANQTNREVRESLTELSHDLRTPLTAASGYAGILKNMDLTEEERLHYLEVIEERFETTKGLVDQLFYFARLESDTLGWNETTVDIRRVLTSVLAAFYVEFEKHNYALQVDIDDEMMPVLGDEDAIKRIFSNIISNGISHGEGAFRTSLRMDREDVIRFEFSNRATNLSTEDAGHLFDRYYTKDKERSKSHTGLGLSIAQKLAAKMGGRCGADLEDNMLTIYVELPKCG